MAEIWPPSWLVPAMKDHVIDFLRGLRIGPRRKKYAYLEWCRWSGVEMTAKDVERVTGVPAGTLI